MNLFTFVLIITKDTSNQWNKRKQTKKENRFS